MNKTKQPSKFSRFLRNNAALLLLIFCVLAIVAVVLAVTLTQNATIPDDTVVNAPSDDKPGNADPDDNPPKKEKVEVSFKAPLAYTSISLEYTDGEKIKGVYKVTLKETSAHRALDLAAADGTDVTAMFDGKVIEKGRSFEMGNYVVVDHGEKVIATYASLDEVDVEVGEQVKQGEVLGRVSTSARSEFLDGGAHLHLEVKVNGEYVDPTPYVEGKVTRIIEK